jgi:hypothetical protein
VSGEEILKVVPQEIDLVPGVKFDLADSEIEDGAEHRQPFQLLPLLGFREPKLELVLNHQSSIRGKTLPVYGQNVSFRKSR